MSTLIPSHLGSNEGESAPDVDTRLSEARLGRPLGPELHIVLDEIAHQVAEHGTAAAEALLSAMSAALRPVSPAIAAMLVDPEGSEVARQRAFGIAHSLLVEVIDPATQCALLGVIGAAHRDARPAGTRSR